MAHQKTCENCHQEFESKRSDARFCTSACKAEFHRNGGPRPLPSVNVRNRPSDEQAIVDGETKEILKLLASDMASVKAILIAIAGGQVFDSQKKSDFTPTETPTFQKPIDPPVAVVAVETEEMIEKRRQLSIKNTLAALDDF